MKFFLPLIAVSFFFSDVFASGVDLFTHYDQNSYGKPTTELRAQNDEVLASLKLPYENAYPRRVGFVDRETAQAILTGVSSHPVASLSVIGKYDPELYIGFCFGRAMTVHLEALYRGVSKSGIKKVFAIGQLSSGTTVWRYHVTTIIKGPEDTWWAIDPVMGRLLTIDEWYSTMVLMYDRAGSMKIYATEAEQFHPGGDPYTKAEMFHRTYNSYFEELLAWYRANGPISGPPLKVP